MFEKGSFVVYGQTGVCEVSDITEKVLIKNQKHLYYVLKPVYQQNNVIYAPVDSEKVLIRPVMTAKEADELICILPEITAESENADFTVEDYRKFLSTSDVRELAKLAANIYQKKKLARIQKKKLGFSDEKYLNLAESLLFGELATALGIDIENIRNYIEAKINKK